MSDHHSKHCKNIVSSDEKIKLVFVTKFSDIYLLAVLFRLLTYEVICNKNLKNQNLSFSLCTVIDTGHTWASQYKVHGQQLARYIMIKHKVIHCLNTAQL